MRKLSELKKILIKNQEKKGYDIYCAASLGYVDLGNKCIFLKLSQHQLEI
jgi:hypothetical protein